MTNTIPFDDWLDEQGDDVRLVMCEGHPETFILVDTTDMSIYKYALSDIQDGVRDETREFLKKYLMKHMAKLGVETDKWIL